MINFIKRYYYKIICYDPIIEELYNYDDNKNDETTNYIASPIIVNRKIRRISKKQVIKDDCE